MQACKDSAHFIPFVCHPLSGHFGAKVRALLEHLPSLSSRKLHQWKVCQLSKKGDFWRESNTVQAGLGWSLAEFHRTGSILLFPVPLEALYFSLN